jgi:membrane peptidoglycan carboxypeptidase
MQLAKNLWLSREKTVARKVQEAFLTVYLEQTLSKQEILETYFNIVEFGPMIYGIRDAADYYFRTTPKNLTLSQALFITSILPNPKQNWFGPDGKLQDGRQKFLRMLMATLQRRHMITQAQYDESITEVLIRGQPLPSHDPN